MGKENYQTIDCPLVKAGNENEMKEGDVVNYHSHINGPVTSTGHVIKSINRAPNNFGCDVAWISNKSGCVQMACLSLAE